MIMTDTFSPLQQSANSTFGERVEVVTDARADVTIAREIARDGSDTRRALDGWAVTSGVSVGGGGGAGGAVIVGDAPLKITDLGDGTAVIEAIGPGVTLVPDGMGGLDITIANGGGEMA